MSDDKITEKVIPNPLASLDLTNAPEYILKALSLMDGSPATTNEVDVGDRCFYLAGGKAMFGIQMFESKDHFLVAMPTYLVSDSNKNVDGKGVSPHPVLKLMKSGISYVTLLEPEHQHHFYQYLLKNTHKMAGFFNEKRVEYMNKCIDEASKTGLQFNFKSLDLNKSRADTVTVTGDDDVFEIPQRKQSTKLH